MSYVPALIRAKWEVMWRLNDGSWKRVKFGFDHAHAVQFYAKAIAAGKRNVTLRSCNVRFPPPDKYADHERYPRGRSKRTREIVYGIRVKEPRSYLVRMRRINAKGWWWCPFCMKLRRFEKRDGFRLDGVWVDKPHFACPACGVHQESVRTYNPIVAELEMRRPARSRNRRRRSRRKRGTEDS